MIGGHYLVNRCYLCLNAGESCNHLLLGCLMTYELWSMVYGLLGISWVMADTVREKIWAWRGLCKGKDCINLIHLIIFWVIWKEMNNRAFEENENLIHKLRDWWFHIFVSILLGHDIIRDEDFEFVINTLTQL